MTPRVSYTSPGWQMPVVRAEVDGVVNVIETIPQAQHCVSFVERFYGHGLERYLWPADFRLTAGADMQDIQGQAFLTARRWRL